MKYILPTCFFILGISLMIVNLFGLTQTLRPEKLTNDELRFYNDQPIDYNVAISQLTKRDDENDVEFADRATSLISQALAHIHWDKFQPEKFNQLVPIWENYFLYFMGKWSNIPEYKRYHFADYHRSLQRGIGICGDASMILSQVLDKNNITNDILTYPGHVVVHATFNNQQSIILDADFGIKVPFDKDNTKDNFKEIAKLYTEEGYTEGDRLFFENMYQSNYQEWRNVKHFITKKYYFEKISYAMKWIFPLMLLLISVYLFNRQKLNKATLS